MMMMMEQGRERERRENENEGTKKHTPELITSQRGPGIHPSLWAREVEVSSTRAGRGVSTPASIPPSTHTPSHFETKRRAP